MYTSVVYLTFVDVCLKGRGLIKGRFIIMIILSAHANGGPRSGSAHARLSAKPPIDTSGNFSAHMSGGGKIV